MYLKLNDDSYRVYNSELRNRTFYVSLQHHQTKEKKLSLYPLHQTVFITCSFLLEQLPLMFLEMLTIASKYDSLSYECIEEVHFNCPFKITTPSGNTVDFNSVKLRWSFTKPSFILITLHPVNNEARPPP